MKKHLSLLACLILVIVVTLSCLISKDNTNNLITDSKGTLAVYLDGEPADGLPGLDTKYRFESIECENGGTASFDWINEKLNVSLSGSDSCNVYYNGKFPLIDDDNVTFYSDGELVVHENNRDIVYYMLEQYINSDMQPFEMDYYESFVSYYLYTFYQILGRNWHSICLYNFNESCSSLEEFLQKANYNSALVNEYEVDLVYFQKLLKHFPEITSVTFDEGITTIGDFSFDSFSEMDLKIPSSVTILSDHAFSLSSINVDLSDCSNLVSLGDYAFSTYYGDEIVFPTESIIKSIGKFSFAYIEDYQHDLVIPDSVETIAESAFASSNIKKVVLPNNYNYTMIEKSTFYGSNIKEIIIPDNIYKIHSSVFTNLSSDSTIKLAYGKDYYVNENEEPFDFTGLNVVENYTE